jgi:hypothetical protein
MVAETDTVFAWSVAMLRQLTFDGDEDALAAYVDALIENNRESEGGDASLLRSRTQKELEEFLGEADAASFVGALMRHLQSVSPPKPPVVEAAEPAPAAAAAPVEESSVAPFLTPAKSSKAEPIGRALTSGASSRTKPGKASPLKVSHRDPEWTAGQRGNWSGRDRERDDNGHQAWGPSAKGAEPRDRSIGRTKVSSQSAGGGVDLRNQLSRSRPGIAKRERESSARDDGRERTLDDRREENGGHGRGARDRNVDRGHGGAGFEPPTKQARHDGNVVGVPLGFNAAGGTHPGVSGGMSAGATVGGVPHGMPPPPPEFFQQIQHMMANGGAPPPGFPPPPGMFGAPSMINASPVMPTGFGGGMGGESPMGGGRGRGGRGRDRGGQHHNNAGPGQSRGRQLNSILVVRNVPAEKLSLGALNEFFKAFGSVVNIQLRPTHNPDHAFIEFSQRSEARAAFDSVDAVLGNRHVRVFWAREQDFEADGIPLAGVELSSGGGLARRLGHQQQRAATQGAPPEDPEVVLQRKRKEIAAAREGQMKARAARQADVDRCIAQQKEMFAKLAAGDCSAETKKDILQEIKSLGKKADDARAWIKAKEAPVKAAPPAPARAVASRMCARPIGAMTADFRPRLVTISDASTDGLTEMQAAQVFRETKSATRDGSNWLLDFSSRRAAESAANALWLVKKNFGPNATLTLPDVRSAPVASDKEKDTGELKTVGCTDVAATDGDDMTVDSTPADSIVQSKDGASIAQEANVVAQR